jgi:hypothetical protein
MSQGTEKRPGELLQEYATKHAKDAKGVDALVKVKPNELFGLLAARVTIPAAMFATPGDRYGTKFNQGDLTRGGPMIELGQRVFFRCSGALHAFLCKPSDEDRQLRESLIKAFISKEVGATGIIAGGLVALFGTAPAAAAIVAAILVQVVVVPTVDVLCEEWDASIARSLAASGSRAAPVPTGPVRS